VHDEQEARFVLSSKVEMHNVTSEHQLRSPNTNCTYS